MRALLLLGLALALIGGAAARAASVVITSADCARLVVAHEPAPDVAYRPGIDVRGRPVVPADLYQRHPLALPEPIVIDIIVPLREFLGAAAPPGTADAEVDVGTVTLAADGALLYEGRPLGPPAGTLIAAECRRILSERD